MHLLLNSYTFYFVYFSNPEVQYSGEHQAFVSEYDEIRFLIELIPVSLLNLYAIILLLLPSVAAKFKQSNG